MYCKFCGEVDEYYHENGGLFHDDSPKHICNMILARYKEHRSSFSKNRDGMLIFCNVDIRKNENVNGVRESQTAVTKSDNQKIRIYAKPKEQVMFMFSISNDANKEDVMVVGIQCAHPQEQFVTSRHPYTFENSQPYILKKKTALPGYVSVLFIADDIGVFEMPIIFTFRRISDKKNLIFVREMVVMVQEYEVAPRPYTRSPYTNEKFDRADHFIPAPNHTRVGNVYKIPVLLKKIFPRGIEEGVLEGLRLSPEMRSQLQLILVETREIFDMGLVKKNYIMYFRHLLWWEETIARINLKKYNMAKVTLQKAGEHYSLEVPGLSENRPSLMRGDRVLIGPHEDTNILFETVIKDIADSHIILYGFDNDFNKYYTHEDVLFDVRFVMSLVPFERTHDAVSRIHTSKQLCRVFPDTVKRDVPLKQVHRYYNRQIQTNSEQKSAVRHILSGTSDKAPYMVFGPPGTGKTMTIVEAIIQIVVSNSRHRVLVCTDSNMAADHIALMLLKYNKTLNIDNYIFRANSQNRVWNVLPSALKPYCNGTSYDNFYSVSNMFLSKFRIVVTTLLHAAKYASQRSQAAHKLSMSHLFIDEAAQASEPAALVPITGLLSPNGQLVLAGDPQQLGPVCTSREASVRGLGTSLMERLKLTFENMYDNDSKYITMLVKNFRSHPDILKIPNELFYDNSLQAQAKLDPLSEVSILGSDFPGGERAIVFHAVNSNEQRMGKSPSYFNDKELDMLKRYVDTLIRIHKVAPSDIGIIAPYVRQVYKMKAWLEEQNYQELETGTVEAFQGKEKRVILVSTVRANCKLLDYDAKYGLGFLVDDKRFNVTLTRAKSKLIIIGNHACLERDTKWRKYMGLCEEFGCYYGHNTQQMKRTTQLLNQIAKVNFDKFHITEAIQRKEDKDKKKEGKEKKK